MEELIVLINFNTYLGGGETLMVRYCSHLQERNISFLAFCIEDSYIHHDLIKRGIDKKSIKTFTFLPDFYYLPQPSRQQLLEALLNELDKNKVIRILTFCMRDVYVALGLSKFLPNCSLTHLILHIEDDKYVGQTLRDKFMLKFLGERTFNNKKSIQFNQRLMTLLNSKHSLISMASIISKYWNREFGIDVPLKYTVPLPSFKEQSVAIKPINNKKILWIGRIVDFKIPSILQMMEFVNSSTDYSMTIVGNGDIDLLTTYIDKNNIAKSKIHFAGQIDYSELPKIIKEHSIGYAMGTSLVELAQFKMPVIIALASFDYKPLTRMVCGGLFYDKDLGCDGSELMMTREDDIAWTIPSVIAEIEADYKKVAESCYNFAKENYSEQENFAKYTQIIRGSDLLTADEKNIDILSSSFLRRKLFHHFNK